MAKPYNVRRRTGTGVPFGFRVVTLFPGRIRAKRTLPVRHGILIQALEEMSVGRPKRDLSRRPDACTRMQGSRPYSLVETASNVF